MVTSETNNYSSSVFVELENTLNRHITPTYGNLLNKTGINNFSCEGCIHASADPTPDTIIDNSTNIRSTNLFLSGFSGYNNNNNSKTNNVIFTLLFIFGITCCMIFSIFAIFNDAYVRFKLSNINSKMKRIFHPEIKSVYKDWKTKFIRRTYRRFVVKICIIINLLITTTVLFFSPDNCIIPSILLSICCVIFTVQYFFDFYIDKELTFYNELTRLINVQCNKKDQ